jgi:hypothetical protein
METCPICGKEVSSGIRLGGELYHSECYARKLYSECFGEAKSKQTDVCTLLKRRFMILLDEIKREPELAEKRMAEAEEKIRRYRDRIFDEQGRLVDPEGLRKALEQQIKISEENARIFLAQMSTILEIAEELNCPNATEMRRIHDLEAHPILTSVFPKMREKLARRFWM